MARFLKALTFLLFTFAAPIAAADVLEDVLERGSLRVGVAEFVPWAMKSTDGTLIGFEIDVARKIAADMGVDADLRLYEWDEIIPALDAGEIDVIAGGMVMTPERALLVDFTRPTAKSGIGIATNIELTRDISNFTELNDPEVVIATVADTYASSVAEMFFDKASVNSFKSVEQAEEQVLEGRAHVYLAGMSEARFLALKNPDTVDIPINQPIMAQSEALAVRKGEQSLLNFLNSWVTLRQTDQWLPMARAYWFEDMSWALDDDE